MVTCLGRGADLHMAQLMPLPLTVCCFSKIQIGFTFLVLAHLGSPGQRAVKLVCVFFFSSFDFGIFECRVLIFCSVQVIQARQIYDEQLPFISKVLSAAIVGESNLI